MGARALDLILARLAGDDVPVQTHMPTECIIRESCGCRSAASIYASQPPANVAPPAGQSTIAAHIPAIQAEIAQASTAYAASDMAGWVDMLLTAFVHDLAAGVQTLAAALEDVLRQARRIDAELIGWQHVISVLRRYTAAACETPAQRLRAEHLWQQARLLVDARGREAQSAQFDQREQFTRRMSALGRELITTFDMAGIMRMLAARLPQLGLPLGYLALYENAQAYVYPAPAPATARLMLAYTREGQAACPVEAERFPSRWLTPQQGLPSDRPYVMHLTSLDFQHQLQGFVMFEDQLDDKLLYRDLRLQISSALQGAILVQRVQEHAHELAAAYEEIRILNSQLEAENLRMGAELDIAKRLQQMILPKPEELRQIDGLEIVGYMQPADEVGGDYYDVLARNGVIHVGIGDVTGHGLESGVLMLMAQTAIRTLIEHGETDTKAFLTTLNRVILKNAQRMHATKP
jgi:hypothetical protein